MEAPVPAQGYDLTPAGGDSGSDGGAPTDQVTTDQKTTDQATTDQKTTDQKTTDQ